MKQALSIGKEPNFQKIIIASTLLHLIFIALVAVPLKSREKEFRSYFVNIVGPLESPRPVRAPVKEKKKSAPVKEKAVVKPEPSVEPETAVKPEKRVRRRVKPKTKADMSLEPEKRVSREIERLQALTQLSRKQREKTEDTKRDVQIVRQRILEGSSSGAGIPGRVRSLTSDASESYYAVVTEKIWDEWIYPDFDAEGLEVIIGIRIAGNGEIVSQEIEQSSGSPLFDRSALKAISKASPLPPPPVEMEIGVRFYL